MRKTCEMYPEIEQFVFEILATWGVDFMLTGGLFIILQTHYVIWQRIMHFFEENRCQETTLSISCSSQYWLFESFIYSSTESIISLVGYKTDFD